MDPIKVALVNDYQIVLEGLRSLLEASGRGIEVVELDIRQEPIHRVDVTLLDTYGQIERLEHRVQKLAADPRNGAIVVFSFSDQDHLVNLVMEAGAQGFVSKAVAAQAIAESIVAASAGERVILTRRRQRGAIDDSLRWPGRDIGLTVRESELLSLLATGKTNRELGQHLFVSENTVKTQLRHLYEKLHVRNRAQAAALASQGFLGDRHERPSGSWDPSA
jgi:DNA-binding NarL/FixJ family response regulator